MKFDKAIGDMTDGELANANYDLQWLMANRENRLKLLPDRLKKNDGSPKFNFEFVNPAFVKLQSDINEEIKVRKARS